MSSKYVYPYSNREAHRLGPLDLQAWTESFESNVTCKRAIEKAITENFDGSHLNTECLKPLIQEFGYNRMNFVLASSIKSKSQDGRFSTQNKEWARGFWMPEDKNMGLDYRLKYSVDSHPAVLDGFINAMRCEYAALDLWDNTHCNGKSGLDYTGKVMVIDPSHLKDEYKTPENQLILCQHGLGCAPEASGRKVFGKFLIDGEDCQYERSDFIGELKAEFLPDWAKEKLQELAAPNEAQQNGMYMT